MDYYYDVLLNFQEHYCMFYEWDEADEIDYVKKIPIFHIDSKVYEDMVSKIIKVNKEFLNIIKDKTKLKQNGNLEYTCIFSDTKNNIALEFNSDGLVINKSSLILDDEININEFMYNINKCKIDYEIVKEDYLKKETRQEEKVKNVLKLEIETMYKNKEISKLKYIYLEWFNELMEDVNVMYQNMQDKLNNSISSKEYQIYELIKLSYNNV